MQWNTGLVWFRRDLRLHDHAALALALQRCRQVHCVFVFDRDILDALPRQDRRLEFLHDSVVWLDQALRTCAQSPAGGLICLHGAAPDGIANLAQLLQVDAVFAARDYEPSARQRDEAVAQRLRAQGRHWMLIKDHVVLEERELLTQAARPFTVFTPYWRAWLQRLHAEPALLRAFASEPNSGQCAPRPTALCAPIPSLQALGFAPSSLHALGVRGGCDAAQQALDAFLPRLDRYHQTRDFPARKGPSYLGVHLRFGTLSIRTLAHLALQRADREGARVWLSELAWRDFYFQILAHYPHVATRAFRPVYDALTWAEGARAEADFDRWCEGCTGYPFVDAGMRQLLHSGYMHNRLRMVTASFLVKHLGVDWRWGERHFAQHLNDYDLAANNGGWQWVASTGCDAQPYFRIFNPVAQSERFDAGGDFIRRYVPELARLPLPWLHAPWTAGPEVLAAAGVHLGANYPQPIVDHAQARQATMHRYGQVRRFQATTSPKQ